MGQEAYQTHPVGKRTRILVTTNCGCDKFYPVGIRSMGNRLVFRGWLVWLFSLFPLFTSNENTIMIIWNTWTNSKKSICFLKNTTSLHHTSKILPKPVQRLSSGGCCDLSQFRSLTSCLGSFKIHPPKHPTNSDPTNSTIQEMLSEMRRPDHPVTSGKQNTNLLQKKQTRRDRNVRNGSNQLVYHTKVMVAHPCTFRTTKIGETPVSPASVHLSQRRKAVRGQK